MIQAKDAVTRFVGRGEYLIEFGDGHLWNSGWASGGKATPAFRSMGAAELQLFSMFNGGNGQCKIVRQASPATPGAYEIDGVWVISA